MEVSILVPIYNTEKYLRQCLESVRQQTFSDFEVLCINDGSTDSSKEIIEEYVAQDSRFVLIDKENTGYGKSMNLGIKKASGKYMMILESDDYYLPTMVEKLYAVMESQNVDIAKADFYQIKNDDTLEQFHNFTELVTNQPFCPREAIRIFRIHPSIWTSMYRKQFLIDKDIWFSETPGASYQDISFSFKALINAKQIVCLEEALMCYRVSNLDSSINNPKKIWCVCDEIKEIEQYVTAHFKSEESIIWLLIDWIRYRNYLWNYEKLPYVYKYAFLIKMNQEFQKVSDEILELDLWLPAEQCFFKSIKYEMQDFFEEKKELDERVKWFSNKNEIIEYFGFCKLLESYDHLYIYGAGIIGNQVYDYLCKLGYKEKITSFVVTSLGTEQNQLHGIAVKEISAIEKQGLQNNLFIVATAYQHHVHVLNELDKVKAKNIVLITDIMRKGMRGELD